MNKIILLFILIVLINNIDSSRGSDSGGGGGGSSNIKLDHYYYFNFTQSLDHFNKSNTITFQQQYQIYDQFFKEGGPLLLLVGPEQAISPYTILYSSMIELAAELNGLVVATEHRYYGTSLPFGQLESFTIENLKYLTIENALQDYIEICKYVSTQQYKTSGKIFTVGGSYGGYLSVNLRIQYPEVISGSVGSAAPSYLAGSGIDVNYWYAKVGESYAIFNQSCANNIEQSFANLYQDFLDAQFESIQSNLNLCTQPTSSDGSGLFLYLKQCFSRITEFNYPLIDTFCEDYALNSTCYLFNTFGVSYQSILGALDICYNISSTPLPCFDYTGLHQPLPGICTKVKPDISGDSNSIDSLIIKSHFNSMISSYHHQLYLVQESIQSSTTKYYSPWLYQSCTQFVQAISGVGIFSYPVPEWTLELQSESCQQMFPGSVFNPVKPVLYVNQTSVNFTNVIFTNGQWDPVRGVSPSISFSDSVISINVENMAHTQDIMCMAPTHPSDPFYYDPASVKNARAEQIYFISKWIEQ